MNEMERLIKLEQSMEQQRELNENNRSSFTRLFTRLEDLEKSSAVRSEQYNHITKSLDEIKLDVGIIKEQPKKRLDTIVTTIMTGIISIILGVLVGRLMGG